MDDYRTYIGPMVETSVPYIYVNGKEVSVDNKYGIPATKVCDKDGKILAVYKDDVWWIKGNKVVNCSGDETLYITMPKHTTKMPCDFKPRLPTYTDLENRVIDLTTN